MPNCASSLLSPTQATFLFESIWTVRPKLRALSPTSVKRDEGTTLQSGEDHGSHQEHVLAALYAAGIDNARLELNGPEVPILDGSAQPFMDAITAAGSEQQDAPRKTFRVRNNSELQRRQWRRNACGPGRSR